jgi:hypothetical protein
MSAGRTRFTRNPETIMRNRKAIPAEIPPTRMFFGFMNKNRASGIIIIICRGTGG